MTESCYTTIDALNGMKLLHQWTPDSQSCWLLGTDSTLDIQIQREQAIVFKVQEKPRVCTEDMRQAAELESEINKWAAVKRFTLPLHQTCLLCSPHITPPQPGAQIAPDPPEEKKKKIPSAPSCEPWPPSAVSRFINRTQLLSWLKNLSLQRSKSNEENVAICCMGCSARYQICEGL